MNMTKKRTLRSSVNTVKSNSTRRKSIAIFLGVLSGQSLASSVSRSLSMKTGTSTQTIVALRPRNVLLVAKTFA
jgi:hypothetical protein